MAFCCIKALFYEADELSRFCCMTVMINDIYLNNKGIYKSDELSRFYCITVINNNACLNKHRLTRVTNYSGLCENV